MIARTVMNIQQNQYHKQYNIILIKNVCVNVHLMRYIHIYKHQVQYSQ